MATGSAQTFCVPALSLTEVPPLTNEVDSRSQILMVMSTLRRNAHEADSHGWARRMACSLTMVASPLTVPASAGHPEGCGNSGDDHLLTL